MTFVDFLILGLACFRLSSMLANDSGNDAGPWDIILRFRKIIGVYYDAHSQEKYKNGFAKGASCMWCNSVWFGLIMTVLYVILGHITVFIFLPFALSGVVVLIKMFSRM